MNRYAPHLYIIPEDDCDRQIADGFVLHDQVKTPRVQVTPPPGGWREVLKTFQTEYVRRLRDDPMGHVVMLIDFDDHYEERHIDFVQAIPADLKERAFVIGAKQTPEALRKLLGKSFEDIGKSLAEDCFAGTVTLWSHEHLRHNDPDRLRMIEVVRLWVEPINPATKTHTAQRVMISDWLLRSFAGRSNISGISKVYQSFSDKSDNKFLSEKDNPGHTLINPERRQ